MSDKTQITNLSNRLQVLTDLRSTISDEEAYLKNLTSEYEAQREFILDELKKEHLTSFKNEALGVTIAKRVDIKVTNPTLVMEWLENQGLDIDDYKRLDTTMIKQLAKAKLKEDGELVAGTEAVASEVLTVTEKK